MRSRGKLVRILADGRLHSGAALATELGVSRSAVWKQVHRLGELGLEVIAAGRAGYRLHRPLELLDEAHIGELLEEPARRACEALQVLDVATSTSALLAAVAPPGAGLWRAALAEFQTGGRGRRGRRWLSPYASGLCLSISWCFPAVPRDLPALSLAAGVAVGRALSACGARRLALKWPNDVVVDGAKLAGILVDVDGESRGPLRAIVGIGINLAAPASLAAAVAAEGGATPAGLEDSAGARIARNACAAAVLSALYRVLREFGELGFAPVADEWRRQDFLRGRAVTVRQGEETVGGIARGIAADGALLVERPEGIASVLNGDVTLRTAA
jgi:BirA family biotin operon repressor/biotin-[acetyl-CoA-carboxylase] ligase